MGTHLFHLGQIKPHNSNDAGTRVKATKTNFTTLQGMAFYKLSLNPRAVREPHWHANADELGYCLKGKVLVSMYATGNKAATYLVSEGDVFFVPSGSLHMIQNVGDDVAELIIQFSNEEPEDFALSSTVGMFTDAVLGNTWNVPAKVFEGMKRSTKETFMALQPKAPSIQNEAYYSSPYRYNLDGSSPLVRVEGGVAKVARQDVWPILKRQALYSLLLSGTGMREPHWHPETAELGYVKEGKGRMSILSPSGTVDTYEMNSGDIYFIPKAYPHHIENMLSTPLQLLIFFDQALPSDIGLTASVKSNADEALAAVLNCSEQLIAGLPTYYADLFIVNKVNPVDP